MNIELGLIGLGSSIVKAVLNIWLNNSKVEKINDSVVDLLTEKSIDIYNARKIERNFENIGDKIAKNFIDLFDTIEIEDNSKNSIIKEVSKVIENARLSHKLIFENSNNPKKIYNILLKSDDNYNLYFSEKEVGIYKRCLNLASQYIIDIAPKLPDYEKEKVNEFIRRFDIVINNINNILEELKLITVSSSNKNEETFERDYRAAIIRKYNKINLFGANIDRNMRIYDLSIAYVDLEITRDDLETYTSRMHIADVFDDNNVIQVVGEAGSGKTTLLQWLAVKSANGEIEAYIKSLHDSIPLVIELRNVKEWPINLENYIKNFMYGIANTMPENWINNVLSSGNMLLMIDGLDEIPKNNREHVLDWIEELIYTYDLKIMISSRPSAKEKLNCDYSEIEILPMSMDNIEKFIRYWHNAVLLTQKLETKENVSIIMKNLIEKINCNEPVKKLASNPLLCAMLCSLHYKNNLNLPSDRNELYEECCKMLLDTRDNAREINVNNINMNYREKRAILDELAYWMIRNSKVSVDIDLVKKHIYMKAINMNIISDKSETENLLKYFVERSGIIRQVEVGVIDFIHKTFQEYMAAKEASSQGDWGLLIDNAEKESWYETIVLAISFASNKYADKVILGLLQKATEEFSNSSTINLIAIACTESAVEVSSEIREKIKDVTKKLIPPKLEQCQEIALGGSLAIPYLEYKKEYTNEEQKACIRTLRMIGLPSSLSVMGTYLNSCIDVDVKKEISNALTIVNRKEIARSELSNSIVKYIYSLVKDKTLDIDYIFFSALSEVTDIDAKLNGLQDIENLALRYYETEPMDYISFFTKLKGLLIQGSIENFEFLQHTKSLINLDIISSDKLYIYGMAKYRNLKSLKKLSISLHENDFINFMEFDNLDNIEDINLYLESNSVEIIFESFNKFKKLKKIGIFSGLINNLLLDVDFSDIYKLNNIECIELCINSDNLLMYISDIICEIDSLKEIKLYFYDDKEINMNTINYVETRLPDCKITVLNWYDKKDELLLLDNAF